MCLMASFSSVLQIFKPERKIRKKGIKINGVDDTIDLSIAVVVITTSSFFFYFDDYSSPKVLPTKYRIKYFFHCIYGLSVEFYETFELYDFFLYHFSLEHVNIKCGFIYYV